MTRIDAIQALAGLALIVGGLWLVSIPMALVTAGALLLILALGAAFTTKRRT